MHKQPYQVEPAAWSEYWDDGVNTAPQALGNAGLADQLGRFWADIFLPVFQNASKPIRLLDAACGTGIVAQTASRAAQSASFKTLEICLTDYAPGAVSAALRKPDLTTAHGFVADAQKMPLKAGVFDLVVSQFGLEYAGIDGFTSAMDVVAPGGSLHCVSHIKGGEIARECAQNLSVLETAQNSGLLKHFIALFLAIHAGRPERQVAGLARKATKASADVQKVVQTAKPGGARDHVVRLLNDMQSIMNNIRNFAPSDIEAWVAGQADSLEAYRIRMHSMVMAALDEEAVDRLKDEFGRRDFIDVSFRPMAGKTDQSRIAWLLSARRE